MGLDRHSIAGTLLPGSRLRRTGTLVLWGLLVAFSPVAPAAQDAATETTAASRQSPPLERADDSRTGERASLASGTVEPQSAGGRSRGAVAAVGVAEIDSVRSALVEAATDDAVDRLYEQIATEPAGRRHRVEDVLQALPASARAQFRATLRSSPQIGGPRFADVRTTQVQLQARGSEVGRVLVELVTQHADRSPVTPEELSRAVEDWSKRSFFGLGGSVRPEVAELLRPRYTKAENHSWSVVDADTTRETILAAHDDAIEQVVELMRAVVVFDEMPGPDGPSAASTDNASVAPGEGGTDRPGYTTLGDLLATPAADADLRTWLADRPIMRLRFEDDREVAIRISVRADDIVTYLAQNRGPENGQFSGPMSVSEEQWQIVEIRLAEVLPETLTGRALAAIRLPVDQAPPELPLATTPPGWTRLPITASGTATGSDGRLLLARKAGSQARQNLRQTLMDLPIGENITVTDLVDRRPEVGELVDRVVKDAHISRTEYGTKPEASVHLSTSGLRFWRLLAH